MLRRFLVIMVVFGITFQIFNKAIVLIDYQINKSYIVSVFCENKDKPRLHCEGQCHLKKQLKNIEKNETEPLSTVKVIDEIQLFVTGSNLTTFKPEVEIVTINTLYVEEKTLTPSLSVFHPPQI